MDCEGDCQNTLHHEQKDITSIGMHMAGLRRPAGCKGSSREQRGEEDRNTCNNSNSLSCVIPGLARLGARVIIRAYSTRHLEGPEVSQVICRGPLSLSSLPHIHPVYPPTVAVQAALPGSHDG
jgi:hypothetical protein